MFIKRLIIYLVLAAVPFAHLPLPLAAQQKDSEEPAPGKVEPADLSSGWWNNLITDKEKLQQTFDELVNKIEPFATEGLTGENQEKAQSLLKDIKLNLQAYRNIAKQPLPGEPAPTPLSDAYTIEDLIKLHQDYAREAIKLEGRKDERKDLRQVTDNLQERIDLVRQQYVAAPERSEEKVLLGFETISLFPARDTAEKKLEILDKTIENETKRLSDLKEEIEAAQERLVSNPREMEQLKENVALKTAQWEAAKNERQQIEASLAEKYSDQPTEEAKRLNRLLQQRQIAADLKEMQARNEVIRAEILHRLSRVLNDPENTNIQALRMSLRDWDTELSTFLPQLREWEAHTERNVERSAQLVSLEQNGEALKTEEEKEVLQKTVELGQEQLLEIEGLKNAIEETRFLYTTLEEEVVDLQGSGIRWLRAVRDFAYDAVVLTREEMGMTLFYVGSHPVTPGGIIQFIVIMVITWWLAKFLTAFLDTLARKRKGVRKAVIYRVNTLFRYFFLFVGLLIALTSIGFDFSNLVIIAGALGIGIGFGLQNIFNDFISGILILFQSQLKVGDFVVIDQELRGEIREINVRSTVITTNDGIEVIIPNSEMVSSRIINWTLRDPYRRMHVPFGVSYGSDIDQVAKVVVEAAKSVPSTLQKIGIPEPQVFMKGFGDSSLDMELVVWIDEKWSRKHRKSKSMYLWAIEKALKKNGITIPFPQRDLHVKTVLEKTQLAEMYRVDSEEIEPE